LVLGVAVLVDGLVVVAGLIGNTRVVGISVHGEIITTIARASVAAVNDVLWAEVSRGPRATAEDVDAISQSRGRAESPAGAAVLRNVLIAGRGEVVSARDIAPVPISRDIFRGEVLVRARLGDVLS